MKAKNVYLSSLLYALFALAAMCLCTRGLLTSNPGWHSRRKISSFAPDKYRNQAVSTGNRNPQRDFSFLQSPHTSKWCRLQTSLYLAAVPSSPLPIPDLPKTLLTFLISVAMQSKHVKRFLSIIPPVIKTVTMAMFPVDLLVFLLFQLSYSKTLRLLHQVQVVLWSLLALGEVTEWEKSILGFAEKRGTLFGKLIGFNYIAKLVCAILNQVGFRIRPDLPILLSTVSYALFITEFIDKFKEEFLHTFLPSLKDNRRQSYVVNRFCSVAVWTVGVLIVCEMFSIFFKVPLSSTLAFGGVGGLAIGLSARDIAANFFGGMLLLFNEPFTPGDMVTFRTGSTEVVGRVERVGWGQTKIRGRDTRSTFVPNSHFVQAAVTNMDRITHRKFDAIVPLRYQDYGVVDKVIVRIKERLRTIPKLDILSQPFRISFVKIGNYSLDVEVTCYFAVKSVDDFLVLQQAANMEIISAVIECGAALALPTTLMHAIPIPASPVLASAPSPSMANATEATLSPVPKESTPSQSPPISIPNYYQQNSIGQLFPAKKPDAPHPAVPPQEPPQADASLLPAVSSPASKTVDIWEGLTRAANIASDARNATEATKNSEGALDNSFNSNVENRRSMDKRMSFKDDIFMASDMYSWSRAKEVVENRIDDDDEDEDDDDEFFLQSLDSIISADKMLQPVVEEEEVNLLAYSRNTTTIVSRNQSQAEWSGPITSAVTIRKYAPAESASAQQPKNTIDGSKYVDGNVKDAAWVEAGSALPEIDAQLSEEDQVRETSIQSPLATPSAAQPSVDVSSQASSLFIDIEYEEPDRNPNPPSQ
eukprot:gene29023-38069_t